jgi:hypothetical protein
MPEMKKDTIRLPIEKGVKGWRGGEASSHHHPSSLHQSKAGLDLKGKKMNGEAVVEEKVQRERYVFRERKVQFQNIHVFVFYKQSCFTWYKGDGSSMSRIDRFLSIEDWCLA